MQDTLYQILFDQDHKTIYFKGVLRMGGIDEYASVSTKLEEALSKCEDQLTIDLSQLEFLNSSGISVLAKFVISVRKQDKATLIIKGSKDIPWQNKSLINLTKLSPKLELIYS